MYKNYQTLTISDNRSPANIKELIRREYKYLKNLEVDRIEPNRIRILFTSDLYDKLEIEASLKDSIVK